MNNKGQTLVIFVILIPLLIVLLALVIDIGLIQSEKTKLNNSLKVIIKNSFNNQEELSNIENRFNELIKENKLNYEKIEVNYLNNRLSIKLIKSISSLFGKAIGINNYDIEIQLTGYKENDKLIIEKG